MLEEKDLQAIAQLMEKQRQDIMSETKGLLAQQKQEILDETTQRMKVLLDTEVTPKFNLLAENQKIMLDKLAPKSELEELRSEVSVLKLAIRSINQEIAELMRDYQGLGESNWALNSSFNKASMSITSICIQRKFCRTSAPLLRCTAR